jgi:uncharacterized protein YdeI (YjbR/CyaY-like superfamily)
MPEIGKTLYVSTRKEWRRWLRENHAKEKEIWLIYYRKETGKPRVSYDDAVEEALCFGWIDSTQKKLDSERFVQRFSVRKNTSGLSEANKERIIKLIKQKKMTQAGLDAVSHVFNQHDIESEEEFIIPPKILQPLKDNKQIWANFQKFPERYKRIRLAYLMSRKRQGQEMFQKSLDHFIRMTAKNKQFGYVRV